MQVDIIREYRDFLLLLLLRIIIKIRVIAIEIILISINLVYNLFNNCDLSKVQILIINISDLTFSSLFVNMRVKILNQLSYFPVNIIIKMLIQIRSKTLSKYKCLVNLCKSPY